jgi:hypothetical protein
MLKEMIRCKLPVRELPIAAGEAAGRALFRLENRKSALPSGSVLTVCSVVKTLPLPPTVVCVCEAHARERAMRRDELSKYMQTPSQPTPGAQTWPRNATSTST